MPTLPDWIRSHNLELQTLAKFGNGRGAAAGQAAEPHPLRGTGPEHRTNYVPERNLGTSPALHMKSRAAERRRRPSISTVSAHGQGKDARARREAFPQYEAPPANSNARATRDARANLIRYERATTGKAEVAEPTAPRARRSSRMWNCR